MLLDMYLKPTDYRAEVLVNRMRVLSMAAWVSLDIVNRCIAQPIIAINVDPTTEIGPGTYYVGGTSNPITNQMNGWTFVLTAPATLAGFGWYDHSRDGLSHSHQIGLWHVSSSTDLYSSPYSTNTSLLAVATVPAGTNAVLDRSWRKVELPTPVNLPIGFYVLAGTDYSENPDVSKWMMGPGPAGHLPGDGRIQAGVIASTQPPDWMNPNTNLFRFPDSYLAGWTLAFGPNLFVYPTAIPVLSVDGFSGQVVVRWPTWATNFVLESSGTLGSNGSWVTVDNSTNTSGDSFVATNLITSGSLFYRLHGH